MIYEISIIECANQRLEVDIINQETDESISIDENIDDVKMLYLVLKEYFEKKDTKSTQLKL
jgi:hypothetical protein